MREKIKKIFHKIFRASLYIKIFYAILELFVGITLFFISPQDITKFFLWILNAEILEDPKDLLLNHFFSLINNVSSSTKIFIAFYLIINGVLKFGLLYSLYKEKTWAYPISGLVISLLILFELKLIIKHFSWFILSLLIVDIILIILLRFEYLRMKNRLNKTK